MVENTKCVFARIVIGIMHDGIRHFKYEPREHNARRRTYLANHVDERQCLCQSFMLSTFDCRNRHRTVANDSGNVEEKVEIDLAFALSSTENDIYDVLVNGADINSALCHTEIEGLDLVPARIELSAAEVELIQELSRETKLKRAIAELKEHYDYILIDCPPSLGLLTVNALTAAGSVLIPMQCEYFAMEGLGQLLNTINLIKENLNPDLTIEGILLTMYDARNNLSKEVMNQVTTHFPDKAFKTVVPRNVALSEAPSYGKPVILYQAKARGTECYIELAKEILNKANQQEQDK